MMLAVGRYVLVAMVVMPCGIALAQSDNEELFSRAVDRLNCEAVAWSMESLSTSRFKENCPCEDGPDFQKVKDCIGEADAAKTMELAEDIERIKKDFKGEWTKGEAVRFLTYTVFNDSAKHRPLFAFISRKDQEDKPRLEQARFTTITGTVAAMLDDWAIASPPVQNGQADKPTGSPVKSDGPGLLAFFLVWLASLLTSVVIIFLVLRRRGTYRSGREVPSEVKNYVKRKIDDSLQRLSPPPPAQPRRLSNTSNDQLAVQVKALGQEVEMLKQKIEALLSNTPPGPPTPPPPPPTRPMNELFLPAPDENGVFGEASAAYNERKHVYRLTERGDDTASFVIHHHQQAIGIALARHDVYIRPVCDASNAYDPKARGIITETPGEAIWEEGKWKMRSKAKIRYEP